MEPSEIRRLVAEIAGEVAGYLRDLVHDEELSHVIGVGASGDHTRRIDVVAENLIIDLVKREGFKAAIVSEERGVVRLSDKPEYILIIDPLDGSMNYVSRITFASLSIAVAPYSEPYYNRIMAGAIANIFLNEVYSFDEKHSYIDNTIITPERLKPRILDTIVIYSNNLETHQAVKILLEKYAPRGRTRLLGSASLEIAYVGLDRIGLFINDTGRLRNLDVAAASKFAEKLGKKVVDRSGRPLDYRLDGIVRLRSIIVGYPDMVNKIVGILKELGRGQAP